MVLRRVLESIRPETRFLLTTDVKANTTTGANIRSLSSFPAIDLADIEKAARCALKLDTARRELR